MNENKETKSFSIFKWMTFIVMIFSISVSISYGSINPEYLAVRLFHRMLTMKYQIFPDRSRPTLSPNYRAFEDLMKMKPFAEVDPNVEPSDIIKELRLSFTMANLMPKPSKCQIHSEVFLHQGHSIDTYWINHQSKPVSTIPERILVYFHGGAYALGDIQSYAGLECHLSRLFNLTVLHLEYRLSPEHLLPAAVEDGLALYRSLLMENYSPSQILFMGDSAGGGLALLTIQSILSHQLPVPRGVITLSPWTDLSASGESYQRNRMTDVLLCMKKFRWLVNRVLGFQNTKLVPSSPVFSPLFGSFDGFPPMFVNVGTAEILEDDSRRVVEKAEKSNVSVTFEEGKDLMHVYPIFFPFYPEAERTLNHIQKWIQRTFSETF